MEFVLLSSGNVPFGQNGYLWWERVTYEENVNFGDREPPPSCPLPVGGHLVKGSSCSNRVVVDVLWSKFYFSYFSAVLHYLDFEYCT